MRTILSYLFWIRLNDLVILSQSARTHCTRASDRTTLLSFSGDLARLDHNPMMSFVNPPGTSDV